MRDLIAMIAMFGMMAFVWLTYYLIFGVIF